MGHGKVIFILLTIKIEDKKRVVRVSKIINGWTLLLTGWQHKQTKAEFHQDINITETGNEKWKDEERI